MRRQGKWIPPPSPPLSEQGPRRDPTSLAWSGPGAPVPTRLLCLPPGSQDGQNTLRARDTPRTPCSKVWGRRAAGPASPGPPVATFLQVLPPPPATGTAWKVGQGSTSPSAGSLCALPRHPRLASVPGRARWSPPGRTPRRGARRAPRPDPPRGTHSGAAAALASWGLSRLPAPRPARNRRLYRASVQPAGNQPSRAGEGSDWLASERTNRGRRNPSAGHCSQLPGGGLPRPAKRGLSGQGRGGTAGARHPIGPRREEAGPAGAGLLLGPCTSPDPALAPGARFSGQRGKLSATEAREW